MTPSGPPEWQRLAARHLELRSPSEEEPPFIGHRQIREKLQKRLESAETAALFLVAGPAGSGKSAIVRWLRGVTSARFVDVRSAEASSESVPDPSGSDVRRLIEQLRPLVAVAGERAVLVYDDADHHLRQPGVARFVREAIRELDVGYLVLTTTTAVPRDIFPISAESLSLERRNATALEFEDFLAAWLRSSGDPPDALSEELRTSLYELSEQTADFRAIEEVLGMLLAHGRGDSSPTDLGILHRILNDDTTTGRLRLPAVRMRDRRMTFRRKDKSELLAELLMRVFASRDELADAADGRLPGFDRAIFTGEAGGSFRDAVMSLCLTTSPLDLVLKLLGPTQIRSEIKALRLDPKQLFPAHDDQAHLLIRGLGFTLIDRPRGLAALRRSVVEAAALADDPAVRKDVVDAASKTIIEQVELALFDLLNFWSVYLYDSVAAVVDRYNAEHPRSEQLNVRRLGGGQLVALLRSLNEVSKDEDVAFRLAFLDLAQPISDGCLDACGRFVEVRNQIVHRPPALASATGPAPGVLKRRCDQLAKAAMDVFEQAEKHSYPVAIKLCDIVFDEYSRKIFRAVDSEEKEIRFTLTEEGRDDLAVAEHYFMLPPKRVSVNPHVVPRSGAPVPVLFERAEAYDGASLTQRQQGYYLLELVEFAGDEKVLDVGSGTGAFTAEVGRRLPRGAVRGIDISPPMVEAAREKCDDGGAGNLEFEQADILDYDPGDLFDVVVSNSAMHWAVPAERSYRQLFRLVRRGGRIAVHQGGDGNYRGLREFALSVVKDLAFDDYFLGGWAYPAYYPTVQEYRDLLHRIGFVDVEIESMESDGSEHPTLVKDFSEAGLLPFLSRIPETQSDYFRSEFLQLARLEPPDLYTHRLYATARRP